ncbi:MAG: FAD-dependent oxidoreductase [Eubacteriales bacterium]|jgi:thioredoxin reductase (NADPH)
MEQDITASYDIIIVGGGIAGLTAAIYAARAGDKTLVLEAKTCGGQIVVSPEVGNYPGIEKISGFELAQALQKQATDLGAEIKLERVRSIENGVEKIAVTRRHRYAAKAVVLATGAVNRPLGLNRENELTGSGVSYCAVCDGAFFKGQDVAVNGGGNTALDDAEYLAGICNKVYLIHRRNEFRGNVATADRLRTKENVEFVLNSNVTALEGSPKLTGVEVTDKITGQKRVLPVSALFIAIGQIPQNDAFADIADLTEAGWFASGEDCRTKTAGIFVAGDCRNKKVRQLTTAASDGAIAALAAHEYIRDQLAVTGKADEN